MSNENNKDVGKAFNTYADSINKGTNLLLDGTNQINKWYAEQLNKISESEFINSRIETNVDNTISTDEKEKENLTSKIETKVKEYNEIQTNNLKNKKALILIKLIE